MADPTATKIAKMTPVQKEHRDKKAQDIDDKISARQSVRDRLVENHTNDLARIDAEIADLQLVKSGLNQLQ